MCRFRSGAEEVAGRQEVAKHVRARVDHAPLASWREVGGDRRWPVGWAGLLGQNSWAAR